MGTTIVIPSGIDFDALVEKRSRKPRSKKAFKQKIQYFLSKVVTHEGNLRFYLDNDGFRPVSSDKFEAIFGARDFLEIRRILTDPNDPIVETNNSYQVGNFCKGYRLTDKYRTGHIEYRTLGSELSEKIKMNYPINSSVPDYSFLKDQFQKYKLEFSSEFNDYMVGFGNELIQLSTNEFQLKLIFNMMGRLLWHKEVFDSKNFHVSVSDSNHRLNSSLTVLPREIRNFIQVDGQQLVEVDLSSSQPFILGILLKEIDRLNDNKEKRINNSTLSLIEYLNNIGIELISKVYPFMSSTFWGLSQDLKESIRSYYSIEFSKGFYELIESRSIVPLTRNQVKANFMLFLFQSKLGHRRNCEVIKELARQFQGVDHFIRLIHKEVGESDFSKFLQIVESHLLIDKVLREFHDMYPDVPLFTIHDSVMTTTPYASLLKSHFEKKIFELTNMYGLVKTKSPVPLKNVLQQSIDEEWIWLENIRTKSQFNSHQKSVFESNVERGKSFMAEKACYDVWIKTKECIYLKNFM